MSDNFADRDALAINTPFLEDSSAFTIEVDEQQPFGGVNSSWTKFTPDATGTYVIATLGSDFDTVLAVYTGTALDNLVEIDSDDDGGGDLTSRLELVLTFGVEYQVQVLGLSGGGNIILEVTSDNPFFVTFTDDAELLIDEPEFEIVTAISTTVVNMGE